MMKITEIKEILFKHEVASMPKEVSHRKNVILTTEIVTTAILDLFSFSIKGAQAALVNGWNLLAFICIICYFLSQVLRSSIQIFTDSQKTAFNSMSDSYLTENVSNISNVVRGKVFKKENSFSMLMTNSEIILCVKEYIGFVWQFWQNLPLVISNAITALIMAFAILVSEFLQTKDLTQTLVFSAILLFCIFAFSILFKKRFAVKKKFRPINKELRKENEVLFNDIKNIEPLIKKEFSYRVSLLVNNLIRSRANEKSENFSLNFLGILRSIVLAFFMIAIIIVKLFYVGGICNLTIPIMTDILAVSTVYSTILDKIADFLKCMETIGNTLKDAENSKIDVDNIMNVYSKEMEKEITSETVDKINVNPFEFEYPGKMSVYKLINKHSFILSKGKSYLVYGHTGCGKSTFMHILVGKLSIDSSPISYGEHCHKAYLVSIMHESNGMLGSNPILDELTFGKEYIRNKMVEILKGTNIYYDILRNLGLTKDDDNRVLEYLSLTTAEQYSSGQKQRLAIVKVLYNMTQDHQIVVFDEATNALDDNTAYSVLKFIADYCQKETPRIVFFVSHQVELTRKITDGSITFVQNEFPSFEISTQL